MNTAHRTAARAKRNTSWFDDQMEAALNESARRMILQARAERAEPIKELT